MLTFAICLAALLLVAIAAIIVLSAEGMSKAESSGWHPPDLEITVTRADAKEIRRILKDHSANGVTFTERNNWLVWVRFRAFGSSSSIAKLQRAIDALETEKMVQDAW